MSGKAVEKIGDLSGYSRTRSGVFFYGNISTSENAPAKKKLSWVIKANAGDKIKVTASQLKAGKASAEIVL